MFSRRLLRFIGQRVIKLRPICQSAIKDVLTALIEVYWARKLLAKISNISEPNLQESQITETPEKEGCVVSS
jgi:hypothetical protein